MTTATVTKTNQISFDDNGWKWTMDIASCEVQATTTEQALLIINGIPTVTSLGDYHIIMANLL